MSRSASKTQELVPKNSTTPEKKSPPESNQGKQKVPIITETEIKNPRKGQRGKSSDVNRASKRKAPRSGSRVSRGSSVGGRKSQSGENRRPGYQRKSRPVYPQPRAPSRAQLLFCPGLLIARPMCKNRFKNEFKNYYLEEQYRISVFKAETFRFRSALTFVLIGTIVLGQIVCFKIQTVTTLRVMTCGIFCIECCVLFLTFHPDVYNRNTLLIFGVTNSVLLMVFPWLILLAYKAYMEVYIGSDALDSHFTGICFIVGLLHLYLISGLPGLICLLVGLGFSIGQILIMSYTMGQKGQFFSIPHLKSQIPMYIALNLLFWYLCDYVNARKRSVFLREGNQLLSLRQLEKEKAKFENLLRTTMPKSLALDVIRQDQTREAGNQWSLVPERIRVQDKVTIIFADIVGFTQMSSGKSAAQLVELLSDLFGRFDDLCEFTGCEKLATLGDCYYCVCGCPEELPDHAARAIDMGLLMCDAIVRFDQDRGESVEMRVGIHSGKVMCGFVGNTRYKYDVLSADVFKANDMESCGEAGRVHVSEATYNYLSPIDKSRFVFEENTDLETRKDTTIENLKTFFVTRKDGKDKDSNESDDPVVRSGQTSLLSRHSSLLASNHHLDLMSGYPAPSSEQEPSDFPAVPPNVPMMKQDRFLINSMNQKRVRIDWFNLDHMSWMARFREVENETGFQGFFQHNISVDETDLVWHVRLTGTQSLLLSSRTTSLIEYLLLILEILVIFIILSISYPDFRGGLFWALAGPFIGLVAFVAAIDVTPLATHNQPICLAYFRKFFTTFYVYQFTSILFMTTPVILASYFYMSCVINMWAYGEMYCVVFSFIFFLNFPRVSAWLRYLFAFVLMVAYVLVITLHCDFANRFPTETLCGIFLIILALLIFVGLEFELLIRADFYSHIHEDAKKKNLEKARERANLELRNVLPEFVITYIDENLSSNYSNSRKNCAIVFFYVDFFEHYSEVLKSGLEWVELLNELICDFDNLLCLPKYSCIFKIKTISSTYMAASNLAPGYKLMNWKAQAVKLMEVADLMRRKLAVFSHSVLQFHRPEEKGEEPARFNYKIGYNIGDVTTGVIGITKPFFDIWGDSVNVASRMYSTADINTCQVTEEAKKFLQIYSKWGKDFFRYRGEIPVKGKGMMKTFELNLDGPFPGKKKSSKKPTKTGPVFRKGFANRFFRGTGGSRKGDISRSTGRRSRSSSAKDSKRPSKPRLSINSNLPKRKSRSRSSVSKSSKVSQSK